MKIYVSTVLAPLEAASHCHLQVAGLLVANCVNSAFNMAWVYNTLVNQFGNLEVLASADWREFPHAPRRPAVAYLTTRHSVLVRTGHGGYHRHDGTVLLRVAYPGPHKTVVGGSDCVAELHSLRL